MGTLEGAPEICWKSQAYIGMPAIDGAHHQLRTCKDKHQVIQAHTNKQITQAAEVPAHNNVFDLKFLKIYMMWWMHEGVQMLLYLDCLKSTLIVQ